MLSMSPRLRKFFLTAHVSSSVGWLGAVLVYLALATASLTSHDAEAAHAGYLLLYRVAYSVIVPLSLAALVSGLVQSLATEWGVFRYYWVLVKFLLTSVAVTVLLLHLPTVARMSRLAQKTFSSSDFETLRLQLIIHAAGGLLVVLAATALSVYKPWGRTNYGRRTLAK